MRQWVDEHEKYAAFGAFGVTLVLVGIALPLLFGFTCSPSLGLTSPSFSISLGADTIDLILIDSHRVTRTDSEFTYRAVITHMGPSTSGISVVIESKDPATTIVDPYLNFSSIPASGTAESLDTMTLRQDRRHPLDPDVLAASATTWSTSQNPSGDLTVSHPNEIEVLPDATTDVTMTLVRPEDLTHDESPAIFIDRYQNPLGLSIHDYFDGDPGPSLFPSAEEVPVSFDTLRGLRLRPTRSLSGTASYVFELPAEYLVVTDSGDNHASFIEGIISSIEIR